MTIRTTTTKMKMETVSDGDGDDELILAGTHLNGGVGLVLRGARQEALATDGEAEHTIGLLLVVERQLSAAAGSRSVPVTRASGREALGNDVRNYHDEEGW